MTRLTLALCLLGGLVVTGGCGGQYILTVPDMIAPAGGSGVSVVRLQRNELYLFSSPIKQAAMRLQIDGEIERGAYTDGLGYAGTTLPAPAAPGLYDLNVAYTDVWGDEVSAKSRAYVWDANAPAIAVDLDCLPGLWLGFSKQSSMAIKRLASGANVVYLTRRSASSHAKLHADLANAGYPEGPILEWQREYWHIIRDGRYYNMPRVVVESRLVSQLPDLMQMLPGLKLGVCDSYLAAKAFAESGLRVVVVGSASMGPNEVDRVASWKELAEKGP